MRRSAVVMRDCFCKRRIYTPGRKQQLAQLPRAAWLAGALHKVVLTLRRDYHYLRHHGSRAAAPESAAASGTKASQVRPAQHNCSLRAGTVSRGPGRARCVALVWPPLLQRVVRPRAVISSPCGARYAPQQGAVCSGHAHAYKFVRRHCPGMSRAGCISALVRRDTVPHTSQVPAVLPRHLGTSLQAIVAGRIRYIHAAVEFKSFSRPNSSRCAPGPRRQESAIPLRASAGAGETRSKECQVIDTAVTAVHGQRPGRVGEGRRQGSSSATCTCGARQPGAPLLPWRVATHSGTAPRWRWPWRCSRSLLRGLRRRRSPSTRQRPSTRPACSRLRSARRWQRRPPRCPLVSCLC